MVQAETDKVIIKDNVTELTSEKFSRSLAESARRMLGREGVLPPGFSIAFHNTQENSWTFGGWVPNRLPSKITTATLMFDLGKHPYMPGDRILSMKDLCSTRAGLLGRRFGATGDFLQRTLEAAKENFDTVKYMRHWNSEYRMLRLSEAMESLFKNKKVQGTKVAALRRGSFSSEIYMPVVLAGEGDVQVVSQVLENWLCRDIHTLPPAAERLADSLRAEAEEIVKLRKTGIYVLNQRSPEDVEELLRQPGFNEKSACVYFDDIPVLVLSSADAQMCMRHAFSRFGDMPALLDFEGDSVMRKALLELPGIKYIPN